MLGRTRKILILVFAAIFLVCGGVSLWIWYQDSQPPVLDCMESLTMEYGEELSVYDLVRSVEGNGKLTLSLSGKTVTENGKSAVFDNVGSYEVTVTVADEKGHTVEKLVTVLVQDTTKPVLKATALTVRLGEEIDYLSAVTAEDGLDGDLRERVSVNAEAVNLEEPGTYPVEYVVTDHAGNYAQASAYVTILPPAASAITLSKTECELDGNGHIQLTATVEPENWTGSVQWSSSDESVAIVHSGLITWTGKGEATITASAEDVSAECRVSCGSVGASSVWLNHHKATLEAHTEVTLTAATLPSNYAGGVIWESTDSSVATVVDGKITWVGPGSCTVRAVADGAVDSCQVVCKEAPKRPSQGTGMDAIQNFVDSIFGN